LTPAQIDAALQGGALPIGAVPNFTSGYGLVQADAAFARIPPGAPAIAASASSVVVGTPVTLTWSSINATACTASGSWSGALAASGSKAETPSTVGTATYTLACANAAGTSPASSVNVTVDTVATQPPSHSGGGSLEWVSLLGLAGLSLVRARKSAVAW
jgi:hypothetical protein